MPNRMDLVFSSPKWILSLFSKNYLYRLLKSLFKCVSVSVTCLSWKTRQESSAYSDRSNGTACFISLTYIRKSKEPRTDHWGSPHKTFEMLEYLFLIHSKNGWSVKYKWNQNPKQYIMVDSIKNLLKIYQYHASKETIIKAFQNFDIQVWKIEISRTFCYKTGLIFV